MFTISEDDNGLVPPSGLSKEMPKSHSLGSDKTLRSSSSSSSSVATNSSEQSIRSARAMKVFGDVLSDDRDNSSLCYSPSPMKGKRTTGLRNITNTCEASPSRVLPFGTIAFTAKKEKNACESHVQGQQSQMQGVEGKKNAESKKVTNNKSSAINVEKRSIALKGSSVRPKNHEEKRPLQIKASNIKTQRIACKPKATKSSNLSKDKVISKKHVSSNNFKSSIRNLSTARKAHATKAQQAIHKASKSVNQTLNATRMAMEDHRRQVAKEVCRLREEWLDQKEDAARFYKEFEKSKREVLNLRSQLSSQYAQNKADNDRLRLQKRLNELDKEILYKSDVFVQHKNKLKENESTRRRMSVALKARINNEKKIAEERITTERLQSEHERLEHKWAGERDAADYLKQCEQDRREMFAFENAEGRRQRIEQAERDAQEAYDRHERYKLKWAGEKDAEEYLKKCEQARRDSFAYRNAVARVQRLELAEGESKEKQLKHEMYETKWQGEKDAEEYKRRCEIERRNSYAFRNAEGRTQRIEQAKRHEKEKETEHARYELKWSGERDTEEYLRRCAEERRKSFAFRNMEGRRQRMEQEERDAEEKAEKHHSYEHKWGGERDAEDYKKKCAKERRESFAFRGQEHVRHRHLMKELHELVEEQKHESYVLKWAAQDDVKQYLAKIAEDRRNSLAFRNAEGKRHRDLEEEWRCEDLQRQHELEIKRAGAHKDVEEYRRKCQERDRNSFCYRGQEIQIQKMELEKIRLVEKEKEQKRRDLETLARKDVDEYVDDCKKRRRMSLALRAKESRWHSKWNKEKEKIERERKSRHTRNMGLDMRYVELAKEQEKARIALDALRHAQCSFSTSNPFGPLLE